MNRLSLTEKIMYGSLSEDWGAHGTFDKIAAKKSYTLWASMNRGVVRTVAGLALLAIVVGINSNKR